MYQFLRKLQNLFGQDSPPGLMPAEKPVSIDEASFEKYGFIIGSVFSYFNDLPPESQKRFIQRVYQFKHHKRFHFIGMEKSEDSAILVSASAIQVSFGLHNYMLSYFRDIYILPDAYRMDRDKEWYIGHVAPDGIYISWKHFLYGYAYRNDNTNVAVHEMAHALLYNNFFAQFGTDAKFRLNYEHFSSSTGPILADAITSRKSYLRNYAFSNMHEFWAVSVEAFFEGPEGLRANIPDLYAALCKVLNQDPRTPDKLLKSELC